MSTPKNPLVTELIKEAKAFADVLEQKVEGTLDQKVVWTRKTASPTPDPIPDIPRQDYRFLTKDMLPDTEKTRIGTKVLSTIPNLEVILAAAKTQVRYNVIKKDEEWFIPGETASADNNRKVIYARIQDLCARVGMPLGQLDSYLSYIADQHQFNPVKTWIDSRPWDGVSRSREFFDTITPKTCPELRDVLMKRWMISAIACALKPGGAAGTGVLVFQGAQYIGKTKWFKSLVPAELDLAADGKHLRPEDRDSVKQAICYWLVELGELDATFRKADIAILKAFLTRDVDMYRAPYARQESKFPRRTVFFGSVNRKEFLADETGNRRFWTIAADKINWDHGLDMQQVWAEFAVMFQKGEAWWLDDAEMKLLNESNREFELLDPWEDKLKHEWTFEGPTEKGEWKTLKEISNVIEVKIETRHESNRLGELIRKLNGGVDSRRGRASSEWFCGYRRQIPY